MDKLGLRELGEGGEEEGGEGKVELPKSEGEKKKRVSHKLVTKSGFFSFRWLRGYSELRREEEEGLKEMEKGTKPINKM